MQHQLMDIFVYDHLGIDAEPIYESAWNGDMAILILQDDGTVLPSILPAEDKTLPPRRIGIPLFPMTEPWKLSHQAPPGLQRKLEKFISDCLPHLPMIEIGSIAEIRETDREGHIVCSRDMLVHREELEKIIFDRRIVYIQGLPSNTIIVCPAPEYTGVLAIKDNDVAGMRISRQMGTFIVLHGIGYYKLTAE